MFSVRVFNKIMKNLLRSLFDITIYTHPIVSKNTAFGDIIYIERNNWNYFLDVSTYERPEYFGNITKFRARDLSLTVK